MSSIQNSQQPSPFGADHIEFDQEKQRSVVVPLRGIVSEDIGRFAPPGSALSAGNVWLYRGGVRKIDGYAELDDISGATVAPRGVRGAFLYRKHTATGTDLELLIAERNNGVNTLYKFTVGFGGAIVQATIGTLNGIDITQFAQIGNRVFIASGAAVEVYNGTTLEDCYQGAPGAFTTNADAEDAGAGYLIAGATYGCALTFFDPLTGDESSVSATLTRVFVGAAGDNVWKVDFPATVPAARFTHCKIYRTEANDTILRYERTRTYTAGVTDISIGLVDDTNLGTIAPIDNDSPPQARGLCVWDGRLWYYGADASTTSLWFAKRGQPCSVPTNNEVVPADEEDGFGFKNLTAFNGRLFAFKSRASYLVDEDPETTYSIKKIEASLGAVTQNAVCIADGQMWGAELGKFWRSDGFRWVEVSQEYSSYAATITASRNLKDAPFRFEWDYNHKRRNIIASNGTVAYFVDVPSGMLTTFDLSYDLTKFTVGKQFFFVLPGQIRWSEGNEEAWVISLAFSVAAGQPGRLHEWFTNSENQNAYQATCVSGYKIICIDPDTNSPHKEFVGVDLVFEKQSTNTAFYTVLYANDGAYASDGSRLQAAVASSATQRYYLPFSNPSHVETMGFYFTFATSEAGPVGGWWRLLGARIIYKPVGEWVRV